MLDRMKQIDIFGEASAKRRRPPVLRTSYDLLSGELVVDNFAGGGGASTGLEAALGRPVDIAINHSAEAIAMHKANHPETRHFCENIWQVDPRVACGSRPVGLAWFSPDCFPAGTMILTREGYRPIEQIAVGDEVLTHRLRWQRVTATMSTIRPLLRLRGHGHPGLVLSPEHPLLARRRRDVWNNDLRRYERTLEPSDWTPASALDKGWYWATPTQFPPTKPPAIPVHRNRSMAMTRDIMWLAGRYVADGWTRLTDTRAELVITCGMHEVDGLRAALAAWPRSGARAASDEMVWHERATGTAYQFTTNHRGLVEWLRQHFGHGAAEKLIPGWALGIPEELRTALLDGYMSGDGCHGSNTDGNQLSEATTVSKALAFGVKALAESLGKTASIYLRPVNGNGTIQGRSVSTLPAWSVRWRNEVDSAHRQTWREDGMEWAPIREQDDLGESAEVFNVSVEEDESYIAEGIVVHNCTHFSRAKGTQPVEHGTRSLAWVVIRWAELVKPRVILLENVEEFQTWGPLDGNRPDPARMGETFRAWLGKLTGLGYTVEFKSLVAADYGTPTTRRRLFLVARRDRAPIVWPEATHGKGRPESWRPAAEIIDWTLPCQSIFDRPRPLAEATLRRIAAGIRRYVVESPSPFLIKYHGGDRGHTRGQPCDEPLRTLDTSNRFGLVEPFVMPLTHGADRSHRVDEPLRTITAAHRGEMALVEPFVVRHGHYSTITGAGLHEGCGAGTFRGQPLRAPLGTVCATNDKHLVCPVVVKHYGGLSGHQTPGAHLGQPLSTVTAKDHHALAAAFLTKFYGTCIGAEMSAPLPTVTSGGGRGGGHLAEVRAFLLKYYGAEGRPSAQGLGEPLHTVTTKARFGLVMIAGEPWQIVDIGMRMLQPHELFAAQGFPEDYEIAPQFNGRPLTKTAQTSLAGNSVCPQVAAALVAANARNSTRQAVSA